MKFPEKNRLAVAAQTAKARARGNAMVAGNAAAAGVLAYFRSGVLDDIPEGVTLADTRLAGRAVLEENYCEAGFDPLRLPGLRAVIVALGAPEFADALEYIAGKRHPHWATNDPDCVLARLGLAVK